MTKKNKNEIAIQLKISKLNCIDDIQAKFHYIKNLKIFLRKINARLLTEILRVKNYLSIRYLKYLIKFNILY